MDENNPFLTVGEKAPRHRIPLSELEIQFARASGPGGQNVNKTSTKAQARWDLEASPSFSEKEKQLIRERLASRLTKRGELVVSSMRERSQLQNKERATERLRKLVTDALAPQEKRIPTKPTRASKRRKTENKSRRSEVKRSRRWRSDE